ncbi:hypothetical protein ACFXJ8_02185 [Nonomuraea sp. NPDC059194]|uniref:hypothetical protein n=1 Tax=Nonomuraea sp. NPDC059194 TaxID=3346764 RepID=UPI003680E4A7
MAVAIGSLTAGAVPQGGRYVSVAPNPARPGAQVTVTTDACLGTAGLRAVSQAFPGFAVSLSPTNGRMRGTTTLGRDLKPNRYPVTVRCADADATGYLTVAGQHPVKGPDTGGGGLTMAAQPSRGPWLAGALAVLVAVGGAATFVTRRKRRPRRDGAP